MPNSRPDAGRTGGEQRQGHFGCGAHRSSAVETPAAKLQVRHPASGMQNFLRWHASLLMLQHSMTGPSPWAPAARG
ncbi:hypothetical protein [Azospirillum palustre]